MVIFQNKEQEITEDIAQALKIEQKDYINLISNFENFYKNRANEKALSLEKAYEILESNPNDDDSTLKEKLQKFSKKISSRYYYRAGCFSKYLLMKLQKKLQEINEAYEIIKKTTGVSNGKKFSSLIYCL